MSEESAVIAVIANPTSTRAADATQRPKPAQIAARLGWVLVALAGTVLLGYWLLHYPPATLPGNGSSEVPELIYRDAQRFHTLWIRWTAIDWLLTFLAAGTAVSAAIKNAYSAKSEPVESLSRLDLALMILAVVTVLATTFDAKLHAGTLAERYRAGDLILQDAEMDYAASAKDAPAQESLRAAWHRAQAVLEGGSAQVANEQHKATPENAPQAAARPQDGGGAAAQSGNVSPPK